MRSDGFPPFFGPVLFPAIRLWLVGGLLLLALLVRPCLAAPALAQQIEAIEASHGSEPPEVVARLRPLEAQARALGGDNLRVFLAAWGYAHGLMDQFTVVDAATAELIDLGEREGNAAAMASAYALRATMLQLSGRLSAAYGWMNEALPWVEKTQDEPLRYWVFMTAGNISLATGHLQEGLRAYAAASRSALAQSNPRRGAQAHSALAPIRLALHDIDGARADAQQAFRLAEAAGSKPLQLAAKLIESLAEEEAGRPMARDRAQQLARRLAASIEPALAASAAAVNPATRGATWFNTQAEIVQELADLHLSARNFVAALSYAERALKLARQEGGDEDAVAVATISAGLARLGLRQKAAGEQLVGQGLAALEKQGRKVRLLEQLNRHADLLEALGDVAGAVRQSRKALALEAELVRSDRVSTVLELQRRSSFEQNQRALEGLKHDNELQASQLERHRSERRLTLGLALAMLVVVLLTVALYRRARKANRTLQAHNAELAHVGLHDRVTGLPNRRALEQRAKELSSESFTGLGIAINRFSRIMGSLGHAAGDDLLCQVAGRLKSVVEAAGGRLYRMDGLSFGAIVPALGDDAALRGLLDQLLQVMQPVFEVQRQQLAVTLSIGAAEYPRDGAQTADIAKAIQLAMRQAQGQPGNSAVVFTQGLLDHQQDRLQLEARLSQALERGELELFYQAQCDLRTRKLSGFEALLRWRSPEGLIPPDRFIPLAEESGLIVPIGRWVLLQACRQAKAWHDSGLGRPIVAVNISPRQFQHPEFMATVHDALDSTGMNPRFIELEITEGAMMDDAESTIAKMAELRALGLHLAIDDFGTGYSSLAYLKRFPINRLKIDRAFVRDLGHHEGGAAIVQAMIQLSHSLGLTVVAEGVEDASQEACLRGWQCDVMQGFGYARPVPVADATAFMAGQCGRGAESAA
ncbi:diguanylate cyclase (GGDEF)-like protein [Pelomonas saccharophila]|uniref:Diguanylate cyclase (GGDEF)-like protein n=1 Tax=Roseateles saccharophilus TaxID=304 RepID=A0ABU1YFB3_ROSSA|nr:GGDEF domain-containing phosphodiesterase [Roseateles saccharophilus]MDR7267537.1 diguanylate cyclase (GGDEF)-like protein [Roseateles saccharophilus]